MSSHAIIDVTYTMAFLQFKLKNILKDFKNIGIICEIDGSEHINYVIFTSHVL